MKIYFSCFIFSFILFGSATAQQKFVPTNASRNQAIARGQGKQYLAAMETMGGEAERQERWAQASNAYRQAASMAWLTSQLQQAIADGTKALELAQRGENPGLEASAMIVLSTAYGDVRQLDKARDLLNQALEITKTIKGDKQVLEGNLYIAFGEFYLRSREQKKAIEYLTHALAIWQARQFSLKFMRDRRNLRRDMELARDRILVTRQRLGNAYLLDKNPRAAIRTIEPAIAFLDLSGFATSIDELLLMDLGRAYGAQKDFPRALEYLTKALAKAEARQHQSAIPGICNAIGQLYTQFSKPGEALPYYKKAVDSFESMRSLLQSEELRTSFVENKRQTYGNIIWAELQEKSFDAAFNYNERARSRAFLDILGSKVQLGKKAALVEEEKELQKKINDLQLLASLPNIDDEEEEAVDTAPLQQQLDAAEKAYADFLAKVRKENQEQASLMNVEPLTAKQVQALLDPEVTLLEYFVANNAVWLWVVEKDQLRYANAPISRAQLVSKVSSFRDAITELQNKEKLDALSQDLYKLLIQPALPFVRGKALLIIPHDALHYLPFQALLAPNGKYLIEDYPINYLSSASLMQFTQEKRKARGELSSVLAQGGKVLTFGNPDLNDPKMNLPFAEIEAREIKILYPQSSIYLEKDATEEKAKALVGDNDIIHFASHAELSENDPLSSAILLAKDNDDDGRLEAREIFALDLKASLVVLSACETGLGKLSSGDELVGLTRAFIYAGTPSVVASLWNVEDSSTAQLMASFYQNLKIMTKVEALRQAQLNLIRGNVNSDLLRRRGIGGVGKLAETPTGKTPAQDSVATPISTSHPYFWAPFILVGEGK